MFVLNENMIDSLNKEDLKMVLESYNSLPKDLKHHISINLRKYVKTIFNDKIYMCETAAMTAMLDSDDVDVITDPTYSSLQSQISIITKKIDDCGCDPSIINDIKRLCDIECYDLNSYILFDAKANGISDDIINSSNSDENKTKAIAIINEDITKFKFLLLGYINHVNNTHITTPTVHYNDYDRIFSIYKHIIKILNVSGHGELAGFQSLLGMYSRITGNSVNRFIYQLGIGVSQEDNLVSESTLEDFYSSNIKPIKIESLGRLTDNIISDMLCLEESNRLIMGDNIFLDDDDRKNVYKLLNKLDVSTVSKIVHDKITFELSETDCMLIFDNENYQMLTTMIYTSDNQIRYLGKYEGIIYLLFKILNKDKLYGINIDDKSIIEISNNSDNFQYKYDM